VSRLKGFHQLIDPCVLGPVVELFSDGEILDSIELYRHGAFRRPNHFPKTFPDHIEINFRDGEILDVYELNAAAEIPSVTEMRASKVAHLPGSHTATLSRWPAAN
jgi:ribosomal protein L10